MRTTIRVTYVRRAGTYRIDEVGEDGVVREEISPAWLCDEAFAEHLAGLVAGYRGPEVSRGAPSRRGSPPGAAPATRSPQSPGGFEQRRAGS